ncbi:serine-rich adhesin for platelets-like isoform X2 [Triticum dicoccoides]|uniref:serine-rich adhesin for platelets-like isoform X2 n=1 Tax=Triticum dicoccoides TaxID=85692 RepID=UPI00188E50DD|nr:serine-rich adhesin for platelets-like isoform X2 [Triticum dicoccoides]
MGGGSLAIVEKKPPFGGGGAGGCAGSVLFHLLDWHRRLARKRRLFSPRRLLPSAARSSSLRRLAPPPPPSPAAPQPPRHAPSAAAGADGKAGAAPPGVVARLMGLESWPAAPGAAAAAPPRPQKQRKVEASAGGGDNEPTPVVVMLPPSRRPPAPGSPTHAPRSHHSADLPARSPRQSRLVHAAASRLLEPGARASSRAGARLQAIAYACSSPQHRGHPGAPQQSWGTLELDDFLSRSDSLSLERRAPPPPELDADQRGNAVGSRCWQETDSMNTMSSTAAAGSVTSTSHTIVVPRVDSYDAHMSRGSSSDVDAVHRDYRARTGGMGSYAGVRSSNAGAGARTGEQRMLRKRGALSRPDVPRSAVSGNLASSTRSIGNAREPAPASSRRAAHNSGSSSMRAPHNSGPRRESTSSTTPQRSTLRDVIDRNGSASTSRYTSNASGQRRGSRKKIDRGTAASNRGGRNTVAFASSSSARPVSRGSSDGKVSENRGLRGTHSDTDCTRRPVVDAECSEAEPCAVSATSEKEEFRRLLKAKVNELGLSDRVEPSDGCSANLTVSVLQELISALTNDTNTSASQSSNFSDSSAPLNNAETIYSSNDQSPEFHKSYQGDQGADSPATCTNDEPNQPSPTSVLEACFSHDASSSGSPTEKIESTEFFISMENKMEDLFNLESDIEDLALSMDTTKTAAAAHGGGGSAEIPCVQSSPDHDFEFLEGRLHSIREAIANAELLLDSSLFCGTPSSLSLHSFIVEMLETVEVVFCGGSGSSFGLKEENKYQRTNFLLDCIVESLDSKFRDFGKCGYKALLRMPLTLSKDVLKREISEEIGSWSEISSDRAAEKELDQVAAARCDGCRTEAFDISITIEDDILEALVGEFAFDQCC